MPVYDAVCRICRKEHTYYQTVDNRHQTPECCGQKTEKVILNAPVGRVETIFYTSPIDGRPITTKQAREEDLRRNNCRPWEGLEQEKKEAARRAEYEEQKQDAKIEKAIEQTIKELPEQKKAILGLT